MAFSFRHEFQHLVNKHGSFHFPAHDPFRINNYHNPAHTPEQNSCQKKSTSGQENDREMKNQTTTESGVYTELDANRMPAYNTYMSLVHHENPCSYVIPSTSYYHEMPENK